MNIQADDLYRIRDFFKLTQSELAIICGVSEAYINMIERNKRAFTDTVKLRLIERLELTGQKLALINGAYQTLDAGRKLITKGDGMDWQSTD